MIVGASTVVCPVVHTWLNWMLIGAFVFFGVAIAAAVAWSMYDHSRLRAEHRLGLLPGDGSPAGGESTGGHGSLGVPHSSTLRKDARW